MESHIQSVVSRTFSSTIESLTLGLFLTVLFLAVALPTGSVYGLNVKVIAFGMFIVTFVIYVMTDRGGLSPSDSLFLALIAVSLGFWSLIGVLNGQGDTAQIIYHLRDLASVIIIAWLSVFAIRRGLVRAEGVIIAVICGIVFSATLKVALVAGSFVFNIDPIQVVLSVFGAESTVAGNAVLDLIRLQFPADILGAFVIFAVLAPSAQGRRRARLADADRRGGGWKRD